MGSNAQPQLRSVGLMERNTTDVKLTLPARPENVSVIRHVLGAFAEALRLLAKHRVALDRIAAALLEKETLVRDELLALLQDVEPESRASDAVGAVRVVQASRFVI